MKGGVRSDEPAQDPGICIGIAGLVDLHSVTASLFVPVLAVAAVFAARGAETDGPVTNPVPAVADRDLSARREESERIVWALHPREAVPEADFRRVDQLGFDIPKPDAGGFRALAGGGRARILARLTETAIRSNWVERASPTPAAWIPWDSAQRALSLLAVPFWDGTRFIDARTIVWNGHRLSPDAKAELALLNEMTRSVDESRFDCLFEPSDVTSATPASVREDLDMAGVSVTFDSAKHLWIVSAYDPVAASVRDRLQAWPSLQARYLIYRRTRGEDDPEVRALLRGMDELGFDVAFSNGIPVEVSSRRAELLASLPKPPPDSGDFVACLLAVPPESWKPVDEAVVRGELWRLGAVPRFVGRSWLDLRKRAENGLDPPPHVRHLLFQLNTLQSRYERESRERELLPPNRLLGLSDACPRELLAFTRMAIYAEGYGVAFDHGNGLWILSDDPEEHPREFLQDVARYERLVGSTNRTDAVP